MEASMLNEAVTIRDARMAAAFASPPKLKLIMALLGGERTLGELSELTGDRLNLLHHHMKGLIELALVEVAHERPRGGRPIKVYRTTAPAFFIPAELSGSRPVIGLPAQLDEALARHRMRTLKGVLYGLEDGRPRMRLVSEPGRRRDAAELWLPLQLSPADGAALIEEMWQLIRRFEAKATPSGGRYIIHAAVALTSPPARNP